LEYEWEEKILNLCHLEWTIHSQQMLFVKERKNYSQKSFQKKFLSGGEQCQTTNMNTQSQRITRLDNYKTDFYVISLDVISLDVISIDVISLDVISIDVISLGVINLDVISLQRPDASIGYGLDVIYTIHGEWIIHGEVS